jgi:hypothetical protein
MASQFDLFLNSESGCPAARCQIIPLKLFNLSENSFAPHPGQKLRKSKRDFVGMRQAPHPEGEHNPDRTCTNGQVCKIEWRPKAPAGAICTDLNSRRYR